MIRAKIRRLVRLSSETDETRFYMYARRHDCEDQGFSDIVLYGEGREHAICDEIMSLAHDWISEGTGLWIAQGVVYKASDELFQERIAPEPAHTADAHQDGDDLFDLIGELNRRDAESATGEYPSRSSGFLGPLAISFDEGICHFDELAHDGDDGDLGGLSCGA